jgi:hypothetical protein
LRAGEARRRPQRGGRGVMQKVSAGERHGFPQRGEGSCSAECRRPPAVLQRLYRAPIYAKEGPAAVFPPPREPRRT